jgi:hypothetical protein
MVNINILYYFSSFFLTMFWTGINHDLTKITISDKEIKAGWAAVQIVNAGGLWEVNFSIDEHPMYVYGEAFI